MRAWIFRDHPKLRKRFFRDMATVNDTTTPMNVIDGIDGDAVTRLIDGAKARVKKVRETDDDETQSGARHEEAGAG